MIKGAEAKRVIALGFFDGVHMGHAALLRKTAETARACGAASTVYTFDRHPEDLIMGKPVPLINSPEDRADIIRRFFRYRRDRFLPISTTI